MTMTNCPATLAPLALAAAIATLAPAAAVVYGAAECETILEYPHTMPANTLPEIVESSGDEIPDTMRIAVGSFPRTFAPSFESFGYVADVGAPALADVRGALPARLIA